MCVCLWCFEATPNKVMWFLWQCKERGRERCLFWSSYNWCVCWGGRSLLGCLFTVSVWYVYNSTTKPCEVEWLFILYSSDVLFLYWYLAWFELQKFVNRGNLPYDRTRRCEVGSPYLSFFGVFFVYWFYFSLRGNFNYSITILLFMKFFICWMSSLFII